MTPARQKIVQYLNEAQALEQALTRDLQSQIAVTPRGAYRSALATHLDETRDHASRVRARSDALGQAANPLKTIIGAAESLVAQAVGLGKAPLNLLRGSAGEEKLLKNAKDSCAAAMLEIATYTALERVARSVGDDETARLAASIRADEEKMYERVRSEIAKLADAVVRADIDGEHSHDATTTGAADKDRHGGKATRDRTRKAAATSRGAHRGRTSRGTQAAAQRKDATRRAQTKAAGGDLRAAAADEFGEPAPVTATGGELPAAAAEGAHGAGPVTGRRDDLRAAAEAGDGAAAFTLWDRLRDTDRAAAERYLRKAADSGQVRAAHRLGMLLWERRDLDAAEERLRSAGDDPQGAHALGLLLWRERGNPQAAVEWLDRAAQADDPAAERDLGMLLREHGDIQGAHHWLSRAADRDGEAREALAELVESH